MANEDIPSVAPAAPVEAQAPMAPAPMAPVPTAPVAMDPMAGVLPPQDPVVPAPLAPEADPMLIAQEQAAREEEEQARMAEQERQRAEQARFEAKKEELSAPRGATSFVRKPVSDEEVLDALDAEDAAAAKEQEEAVRQEQAALAAEDSLKQARIDKRRAALERANARGIAIEEDPEIDALIEQQDMQEAATEEDVQAAQVPTKEDVEAAAEPQRQVAAQQLAQVEVQKENVENEQKAAAKVEAKEEKARTQFTSMEDIFQNASTGRKIRTAISVILGGIGAGLTGGPNMAVQALNKTFDSNLKQQKLNQTERAARKKAAWDQTKQILELRAANTTDKLQQQKIRDLAAKADEERRKLSEVDKLNQMIKDGKLKDTSKLEKVDKDRAIRLPDGTLRLADNKAAADDIRTFNGEVIPAITAAKKLIALSANTSRFNLIERNKMKTELKALVGQLRIPFTGPGVLTDTEFERLVDTIGDPADFFSVPALQRAKLQSVVEKLSRDSKARYKSGGVEVGDDLFKDPKHESRVKAAMDRGLSKEKAEKVISKLKAEGKL